MQDDQFTKLFKYIVDMDKRIEGRFDSIESDISELRNLPDAIGGRFDDTDDEQAARDAQFARLVEWAREVSKKTGVPLPNL